MKYHQMSGRGIQQQSNQTSRAMLESVGTINQTKKSEIDIDISKTVCSVIGDN